MAYAPRVAWAVDIIPSMPTAKSGATNIFLAVDMFTGFIQLKALKTRQTSDLIDAVKSTIISPFGVPKFFRCDNETSMANSAEFLAFMEPLKISFLPCSTASPWSNGAAERAVQTIKKAIRRFVQQEKSSAIWDEYLHFFSQAHNKSCTVYDYTPEQLQFGYLNPSVTDLIEMWPKFDNPDVYLQTIVPEANEARKIAHERATQKNRQVQTYRNQSRLDKSFRQGQIVLHRQLQVSTGTGGALKPKFTGPYVIEEIDKDDSSATLEHLHTKQRMQAHFTNIQLFEFDPVSTRLPEDFDDQLKDVLTNKSSDDKYRQVSQKKRKLLNKTSEGRLQKFNEIFTQRVKEKQKEALAKQSYTQGDRPRSSSIAAIPNRQQTDLYKDPLPTTSKDQSWKDIGQVAPPQPSLAVNNDDVATADTDDNFFGDIPDDDFMFDLGPPPSPPQPVSEGERQRQQLISDGEAFHGFEPPDEENYSLKRAKKSKGKASDKLKSKNRSKPTLLTPPDRIAEAYSSEHPENQVLHFDVSDEFFDDDKELENAIVQSPPAKTFKKNKKELKRLLQRKSSSKNKGKQISTEQMTTRSRSKLSRVDEISSIATGHRTSVDKLPFRDKTVIPSSSEEKGATDKCD